MSYSTPLGYSDLIENAITTPLPFHRIFSIYSKEYSARPFHYISIIYITFRIVFWFVVSDLYTIFWYETRICYYMLMCLAIREKHWRVFASIVSYHLVPQIQYLTQLLSIVSCSARNVFPIYHFIVRTMLRSPPPLLLRSNHNAFLSYTGTCEFDFSTIPIFSII